ncbi:MAG: hypothetical protein MJ069_10655, partial [Salinivirgaceae bacterium]|nr:hypothetical protein [Salinivirgaceae bacterium]
MTKTLTSFRLLRAILIMLVLAMFVPARAAIDITASQPANGTGTTADPYQIGTPGELYWFAEQVNNGQNTISAKLTADIVVNENVLKAETFDLNGTPSRSWTPIGKSGNNFKGTFDGNGHTISGLYFKNTTNSNYPAGGKYIGLIGYAYGATIKNVVVKDSYLYGYQFVAGICGYAGGSTKITNCGYEGYVYGSGYYACGIAYNYSATVENCYSVSNETLADNATTNCYHDNTKYTESTTASTGKPSEAFASGEVAFLLGEGWGQKIGTDVLPIPGSDKVYKNTYSGECPGVVYSNDVDEHGVVTERNHNCNEEGACTQCGFYFISTADQLYAFAAKVNAGGTTLCAKLTADIVVNENVLKAETFDLNGTPSRSWTPIGKSGNNFKGTFDGNGHTISGLYFNNTTNSNYPAGGSLIGLIGWANGAAIKNVVVKDSYLRGYNYVSGICGYANGSTQITNCGYEGYVYGSSYAYGIACNYSATVKNCYSVSNKPLSNKATTNCYHDNNKYTESTTASTGKPSAAFASGEVAWLLGDAWGQKIGTDVLPIPGGDKVYATALCPHAIGGSNTPSDYIPITDGPEHYDSDGYCEVCGAGQPATLVDGYYEIDNVSKLYWFANQVNNGQNTISAKLTADIVVNENVLKAETFDLNGTPSRSWTPIGKSGNNFKGTFDGNGHTISGLYFNNTSSSNYPEGGQYIGLIGCAYGATIKNVVVKDSYLRGYDDVAGICGYAYGSTQITNCGYEGYVYSSSYAYGIAYNYSATVENC